MAMRVSGPQLTICRHDLGTQHVVRGQAEPATRQAHPAAERMAGDTDRRARAGGNRQPVRRQRRVDVDQLRPGADRRRAVMHVDSDRA